MKTSFIWVASAVLLGLSSCSKDPVRYRLSKDQLAWQGYQEGEVLRFGHDRDSKVRTYRVTGVEDRMVSQSSGTGWSFFGSDNSPQYQRLTVMVQRTDSASEALWAFDLELNYDADKQVKLDASAQWGPLLYGLLPLDELNQGVTPDPVAFPATELLPSATFGASTYAQVIHITNQYPYGPQLPGFLSTCHFYYAKGKGVVAYESDGSGQWYRLP
jgi:hypothetical protein